MGNNYMFCVIVKRVKKSLDSYCYAHTHTHQHI